MKRHKLDVPMIRNLYLRLAENHQGIHVDDENTQKEYCRPSYNVAERSLRPEILPQEEQTGGGGETERNSVIPKLNQMLHGDSLSTHLQVSSARASLLAWA